MISRYSRGAKKRWEGISSRDRSERMRALVAKRWKKTTKAQRRAHALKLVKAKALKHG